eukprot:749976-Hanusia_phi.AAC.3
MKSRCGAAADSIRSEGSLQGQDEERDLPPKDPLPPNHHPTHKITLPSMKNSNITLPYTSQTPHLPPPTYHTVPPPQYPDSRLPYHPSTPSPDLPLPKGWTPLPSKASSQDYPMDKQEDSGRVHQ